MKKIILLLFSLLLTFSIFGNENKIDLEKNKGCFDLTIYGTNRYAVGDMANFAVCNVGGGTA